MKKTIDGMTIDGNACEMIAWVSAFLDVPKEERLNFWQADLYRSPEGHLFVLGEGGPDWIADGAKTSMTWDDGLTAHILDEATADKVATAMEAAMAGGSAYPAAKRQD